MKRYEVNIELWPMYDYLATRYSKRFVEERIKSPAQLCAVFTKVALSDTTRISSINEPIPTCAEALLNNITPAYYKAYRATCIPIHNTLAELFADHQVIYRQYVNKTVPFSKMVRATEYAVKQLNDANHIAILTNEVAVNQLDIFNDTGKCIDTFKCNAFDIGIAYTNDTFKCLYEPAVIQEVMRNNSITYKCIDKYSNIDYIKKYFNK